MLKVFILINRYFNIKIICIIFRLLYFEISYNKIGYFLFYVSIILNFFGKKYIYVCYNFLIKNIIRKMFLNIFNCFILYIELSKV